MNLNLQNLRQHFGEFAASILLLIKLPKSFNLCRIVNPEQKFTSFHPCHGLHLIIRIFKKLPKKLPKYCLLSNPNPIPWDDFFSLGHTIYVEFIDKCFFWYFVKNTFTASHSKISNGSWLGLLD